MTDSYPDPALQIILDSRGFRTRPATLSLSGTKQKILRKFFIGHYNIKVDVDVLYWLRFLMEDVGNLLLSNTMGVSMQVSHYCSVVQCYYCKIVSDLGSH